MVGPEPEVEEEEGAANRIAGPLATFITTVAVGVSLFHLYAAYEIVSAHVANNAVTGNDVPELIQSVFNKLNELATGEETASVELTPAVPIKKSVTDDYIICLEDGKKLKMLKRHLMTHYNLTPDQYRQKWGLAADYPMVAPNYAEQRRTLAKAIGLGTKRRKGGRKAAAK